MGAFLTDFARTLQWGDLADIVLVAIFLFVGITWLRRSRSGSAARRIVALGGILALVYLIADLVHLYLFRQLLQLITLGFLIAAAVVFQSDIRRLLDQLGSWGDRDSAQTGGGSTVEMLIEVANQLARNRIGAIIALRGRDPLDAHAQGGVELDGVATRPLLESIFHPESPGHDGAVLMEGDRVTRFGAHLPLAARIPEVSRYGGTRHAAALGLAEETDAFVLVVSEERGTISVAQGDRLEEIETLGELGTRLSSFWNEHYSEAGLARGSWWNRSALESVAMSLGLAAVMWLLFSYSANVLSRSFEAPVEFRNLPPNWVLDSDTVPSALVTLTGSERAFARLDGDELIVSFDLSDPEVGQNVLTITSANLTLPSGLQLSNVQPREILVEVRPRRPVTLPIQIRTRSPLPDSVVLVAQPRAVTVLLSDTAEAPRSIRTAPVDLPPLLDDRAMTVALDLPPGVRLAPDQPDEVTVSVWSAGVSPSR